MWWISFNKSYVKFVSFEDLSRMLCDFHQQKLCEIRSFWRRHKNAMWLSSVLSRISRFSSWILLPLDWKKKRQGHEYQFIVMLSAKWFDNLTDKFEVGENYIVYWSKPKTSYFFCLTKQRYIIFFIFISLKRFCLHFLVLLLDFRN